MTDLKPANTLYNVEQKKGMLIGLGGVTKGKDRKDLESFPLNKICQYTYKAPEIDIDI